MTIDDLLSGEKLLSIAEKENKSNIRSVCDLLFGIVDICSFLLIMLPLYPNMVDGYIYSVNLFAYTEIASSHHIVYWILFLAMKREAYAVTVAFLLLVIKGMLLLKCIKLGG